MRSGQSRFSSGSHVLSSLQAKTTMGFYTRALPRNVLGERSGGDAKRSSCLDVGVSSPCETRPCADPGRDALAGAVISLLRRETQLILPGCLFHSGFKEGKPHQGTAQPVHEAERDFLTQAVPSLP